MNSNVPISTQVPLLAALPPLSQGATTRSTGWIPVSTAFQFMAAISVGVLGSSATVNAKLEQATSAAGAGAKDVPGKAITEIDENNKTAVIVASHNDIDMTNGFTHIRLSVTVGTAASLTAAALYGAFARYENEGNNEADEVVT